MGDGLNQAKEFLNELERDIDQDKIIWDGIKELNPDWEQLSEEHWIENEARYWIHGATNNREANELERWLFDNPPLSELARSDATKIVKTWREWLETENAYYEPFKDFEFEEPSKEESLVEFILEMAKVVKKEGQGARLEWRAFKSFLSYLRRTFLKEAVFIEQIFPQKMDVQHGIIVRKITPEVPSIPQEIAVKILKQLIQRSRFSRRNAQLSAAESLGLCWLCLTASRLQLPIYLEVLWSIKSTAIQLEGEFPTLLVPTFFGDRSIRISWRVAKFLKALSLIPSKKPRETILQSPLRSLNRTLEEALKAIAPNPELGNITYVSLLSPPHFYSYRYQPK